MNKIRQIQQLNKRELEAGISTSASWHTEFRDTAYIYIGGLPFELSEGDVVTIFSQFGEPVHINLVRDKETGKSKGFCFLKYEDQRSTDLAVDNLSGAKILDRVISVDHTRYKKRDDEEIYDNTNGPIEDAEQESMESSEDEAPRRPLLDEERQLARLKRDHDDDDPMKAYLLREKEEEVRLAVQRYEAEQDDKDKRVRHHRHHHRHRHHRASGETNKEHGRRKRSTSPSRRERR